MHEHHSATAAMRLLLSGFALGFLGCSARNAFGDSPVTPPFVLMIDDFEHEERSTGWTTADGATSAVVPGRTRTGRVMRFRTDAYREGPQRWPLMQLTAENGLPGDWSEYDELVIDVRLEAKHAIAYGMCVVAGPTDKKYYTKPVVTPGAWQTVRHPVRTGKMDPCAVKRLRLYITEPAEELVLYVDNVRLESSLPRDLRAVHYDYLEIGDRATADRIERLLAALAAGDLTLAAGRERIQQLRKGLRGSWLTMIRSAFAATHPGCGFAVAHADSMVRVMPRDHTFVHEAAGSHELGLARGEREAFQVVVIPPANTDLADVSVEALPFVHADDGRVHLAPEAVRAFPVGFVKTRSPQYQTDYVGWYPDPILEFLPSVDVKANELQPFWVRVATTKDTRPGLYRGGIRVSAAGSGSAELPVTVRVWNFCVPVTGHLRTAISLYGHRLLPREDMSRGGGPYDWVLQNYRLNPFSIYSDTAYGPPRVFPISEYKRRLPMGLNAIPLLYLKLPRQALFSSVKKSREKWAQFTVEQKRTYPEAAKQDVLRYLRERVPLFREAGLLDLTYCYGFDEAKPDEWPAVADLCQAINAEFPELHLISTAYDPSYGLDSILGPALDGWIPHWNRYNPARAAQARKAGHEVWWYSTRMFIDRTPLRSIRSQMGFHAFVLAVDGWLYWTITRWAGNDHPITSGPYTDWDPVSYPRQNGGGSFVCCGPVAGNLLPTIRLENIRDGLEDYEYLYLLREHLASLPTKHPLRARATQALSIGKDLVDAPTSVPNDHRVLRRKRREIANVLERLNPVPKPATSGLRLDTQGDGLLQGPQGDLQNSPAGNRID